MAAILGRGSLFGEEKKRIYLEKKVHPAGVISWVAAASACTEVGQYCFAQAPDLAAALTEPESRVDHGVRRPAVTRLW